MNKHGALHHLRNWAKLMKPLKNLLLTVILVEKPESASVPETPFCFMLHYFNSCTNHDSWHLALELNIPLLHILVVCQLNWSCSAVLTPHAVRGRERKATKAFIQPLFSHEICFSTVFGISVAMRALFHGAWATSHPLPQPTQEITDFQGIAHESGRSAQDRAAFTTTLVLYIMKFILTK